MMDENVPAGLLGLGGILLLHHGGDGLPGDGGEGVTLIQSGHDEVELLLGSPDLAVGVGGGVGVRHCVLSVALMRVSGDVCVSLLRVWKEWKAQMPRGVGVVSAWCCEGRATETRRIPNGLKCSSLAAVTATYWAILITVGVKKERVVRSEESWGI